MKLDEKTLSILQAIIDQYWPESVSGFDGKEHNFFKDIRDELKGQLGGEDFAPALETIATKAERKLEFMREGGHMMDYAAAESEKYKPRYVLDVIAAISKGKKIPKPPKAKGPKRRCWPRSNRK